MYLLLCIYTLTYIYIYIYIHTCIYIVIEGGSSDTYVNIKKLLYTDPHTAHILLTKLADNIVEYICYQIESGAQMLQLFDSWAGHLSPDLYKYVYM